MSGLQECDGQAVGDDSFGFDVEGRPVDLDEDRQPLNSDGVRHNKGFFYICLSGATGPRYLEMNVVDDRTTLKTTTLGAFPDSVRKVIRAKLGDQLEEISRAAS